MRPVRRFEVRPAIPEALSALPELASNLHWAWDRALVELFERIWPGWSAEQAHPAQMVRTTTSERLPALAADQAIINDIAGAKRRLDAALTGPRGSAPATTRRCGTVAYFSPEFGISEAVPQYSGGLGVLAGDHLKASSDLGVPLVGVGLLYTEGYFRQRLDADGWQQESIAEHRPRSRSGSTTPASRSPSTSPATPRSHGCGAADVGQIPLYLLDTDLEGNSPDGVAVTDRLYGGD